MLLFFFFSLFAACFPIGPVSAGSRLWELPIHQLRGNATAHAKLAVSVIPGTGAGDHRLWPDRTITYAFADSTASSRLKAMFFQGTKVWSRLKAYDFQYNLVSTSKCKNDRMNCLMVYYNTQGFLAFTVAKPPATAGDPSYEGPTMYLSDSFAVGNRNPIINIAHEIGHAWGLYHEHQNFRLWRTSDEQKQADTG
ncbi:hypothetical protein QQZ08_009094 [Neonectria magnoliae]|uniref:Peptidase M12A domain-containing protein n=1 Tax=Neonectria magnoliae TaxID=2732573 RepID=A0ABR1HQH1_9HYPO